VILSSIHISSFAALASLDIELKPRMNVILGPNEAGKSTLFSALQHLLLTPVDLRQRSFQDRIRPFLPVGGGDTISCALEFRADGGSYRLEKSWGSNKAALLELPDGSRITDAETVEARLAELLPAQPGTLRTVFLTRQSGLATTLEELRTDAETVYGLSDLLHRSVLETDGVSLGRFQETLERLCGEYLSHWDLQRQRPESKRGGKARWPRERGMVLEAHYALEDAESRYQEVKEKEDSFAAITEELEICTRELEAKTEELSSIEAAAKDAESRRVLETELRGTELSLREAQDEYESWTKYLLRKDSLKQDLPELEHSVQALELENKHVQSYLEKKDLIERFRRIQAMRQRLEEAEAGLSSVLPLPRRQLDQLRASAAEIDRVKAALQAGNLAMTFHTREAVEMNISRDMEEPADQHLAAGSSLTVEAAGKIELRHPSWNLQVRSGREEFDKAAQQYEQLRSRHRRLLAESKVSSLEEAEKASARYEDRLVEVERAQAVYKQELGEDTFEALEAACGETPESPPPRQQGQVLEELVGKRSRLQTLRSEAEQILRSLEGLLHRYGDKDSLFARIAELGGIKRELEDKKAGLRPLPEGFGDSQSLLDHYDILKDRVQSLAQRRIRLDSDCRNAETSLPDESSEEAASRTEEARAHFDTQVRKAEVLIRIQKVSGELLEELDRGFCEPFTNLVSRYLELLSSGRYREIPAEEAVPTGVIRGDGRTLPYDLLSAGTRDLFALAVRLAMAEFFLGDGEGFLILDDPFVDLDPERQQLAASVLAEFAGSRQLIVFTCQPTHAALLGDAHRIELDRSR
jgi:DNA repair exonuclease SbcCD ATPase subunit